MIRHHSMDTCSDSEVWPAYAKQFEAIIGSHVQIDSFSLE